MRRADANKVVNTVTVTAGKVERLERESREQRHEEREAMAGTAIVLDVLAYGDGALVDIEIMSGGVASGRRFDDVVCHSGLPVKGGIVQYIRRTEGTMEIVAGGGATAAASGVQNYYNYGVLRAATP